MKRTNSSSSNTGYRKFSRSRRKKKCPFTEKGVKHIDYKDTELLVRFITERGKILPRRITGVSARHQSLLTVAVKRARYMALLPFVAKKVGQ